MPWRQAQRSRALLLRGLVVCELVLNIRPFLFGLETVLRIPTPQRLIGETRPQERSPLRAGRPGVWAALRGPPAQVCAPGVTAGGVSDQREE